jgi:2-isopropylmalate synthase
MPTSKLLTNITGVSVQPNKAVVGDNAFAHESGIHQDGVLKNAMTYEIMRPEDIGITKSKLVLGKHSGRHAVLTRLKDLGYELKQEELDAFFVKFKSIADSKKEIYDEDLIAILGEVLHRGEEKRRYTVENVQISTGMSLTPVAVITIKDNESNSASVLDVAHGNGGVDAGVKAVKKITGSTAYIRAFNLVAITGGSDALCEVSVTVEEEYEGKMLKVFGNGMSIDISVAGIMSFVDALNKLDYMKKTGIKQNHYLQDGI